MIYFTDQEIDQMLTEDVPYGDITTSMLKLENKPARIQIFTRESSVVCCTEEVMKIFSRTGAQTTLFTPSGEHLEKNVKFLEGEGLSGTLFSIARTVENLLRYSSGIATRTRALVEKARSVNKSALVVTTRKTIPYTRKIAIKAVKAGGAAVYRLGLSDSILVYSDHIHFLNGIPGLQKRIQERKTQTGGHPIIAEATNGQNAIQLARGGVDYIQTDHLTPAEVKKLKKEITAINPNIRLVAAGNITLKNVQDYAVSGADILVSSWPYYGEPCEMGIKIMPIFEDF